MTITELETRLASLGQALPPRDPTFAARVMDNLPAQDLIRPASIHLFIKAGLALAASLALVVALWSLLITTPEPAFAIAELPERVRQLNTLHMVGLRFPVDNSPPRPLEYFVRQPSDFRVNGSLGFLSGTGNPVHLSSVSDIVSTADEMTHLEHLSHSASIRGQSLEQAQAGATRQLNELVDMLFGPWSDYHKLRDETLGGRMLQVYECRPTAQTRSVVWVSPQNGLPVQIEHYSTAANTPERLEMRITKIAINEPIDDDVFHPATPPGYKLTRLPPLSDADVYGGASINGYQLLIRYVARTPSGEIVICWAVHNRHHNSTTQENLFAPNGPIRISFTSAFGNSLQERLVRLGTTKDGYTWRWSVLHQSQPEQNATIHHRIDLANGGGNAYGDEIAAKLDRREFDLVQRQTLPASVEPMSVEQFEAAAK